MFKKGTLCKNFYKINNFIENFHIQLKKPTLSLNHFKNSPKNNNNLKKFVIIFYSDKITNFCFYKFYSLRKNFYLIVYTKKQQILIFVLLYFRKTKKRLINIHFLYLVLAFVSNEVTVTEIENQYTEYMKKKF